MGCPIYRKMGAQPSPRRDLTILVLFFAFQFALASRQRFTCWHAEHIWRRGKSPCAPVAFGCVPKGRRALKSTMGTSLRLHWTLQFCLLRLKPFAG
ncbi:hypothetical protein F4821DRAFT_234508 [Hypoxylon rubiginosum]|uniref:Uncharacterized protein n=1 Tax=Hypoxylon rubiginosum TaxID=110542 RepID=A0ACC0D5Z0_9PEZI|nr:hypothetical protein F4821DRAFT_234508 [Hypoxylon rubiginosum]